MPKLIERVTRRRAVLLGIVLILWSMGVPSWLFERLEGPQIVMLIGLAVALFGLGWQIYRTPSTQPDPEHSDER